MYRLPPTLLLLLAACTFDSSSYAPPLFDDGGPIPDAASTEVDSALADASAVDASPAADAETCIDDLLGFAPLNMDPCDPLNPVGALTLSAKGLHTFNTSNGVLNSPNGDSRTLPFVVVPQAGGPDLLVSTATNFSLGDGASLVVTGTRALVIIATETISIEGRFAAVGVGPASGPGGNHDSSCLAVGRGSPGQVQSAEGDEAGSGGGGGGFAGAGGQGALVANTAGANSPGGAVAADLDLVPLRGGCAGGVGGNSSGGAGGGAGGAVQLVAGTNISLSGGISVSGGGGQGVSGSRGGGGGGGSGGGLLLQSPSISGSDVPTANGGGGGEGSRTSTTTDAGDNGSIDVETPADGGNGISGGGTGGSGGTPSISAGNGSTGSSSKGNFAGGGGGGGGPGRIVLATP